ncbi:Dihydropteroate synthase [Rubripirellula lacrimiformis]|uniref:Dihydropteroate synthase n=1 Tax=Rubripirellula lacrimiformis TaxID=1930273 RepID=A0A517N8Y1_9BACT|nr:dihydropteroate synthase [Rubripirellula lacrimiformis]QDT03458.1 Dihydropteroate synthase [Rubripirellula lacrimiformis]
MTPEPTLGWNLGRRTITFQQRPRVMGILNVTPDSFSDGGKHQNLSVAVDAALQMQADGADIIDIGGESTRPYSDPVGTQEELDRVIPVIDALLGKLTIPISIDTSKSAVAQAAIDCGAEIINDVTGLEGDPAMVDVAVRTKVGVCVMHMRGTPQTMQDAPQYADVVDEIRSYLIERKEFCLASGISLDRICLDPGIGFGKTHEHNLDLLAATGRFTDLGCPILIGHSRKGFIRKLVGDSPAATMAGTLAVSLAVAAAGAHIVRVHDVRETVAGLRLFAAVGGLNGPTTGT